MNETDYGNMILDFRAKHNLSMKDFAELSHLTTQTVWGIENHLQKPIRLTVKKIENVIKNYNNKGETNND